jgi:hypothetical protein
MRATESITRTFLIAVIAVAAVGVAGCGSGTRTVAVTRTVTSRASLPPAGVEAQFCNSDTGDTLNTYGSQAQTAGNKGDKAGLIKYTTATLRLLQKGAPAVDCVANTLNELALSWTTNAGLWGASETAKYVAQIRSVGRALHVH